MTARAHPGAAAGRRRGGRWLAVLLVLAGVAAGWWYVHQQMPGWYARMWYPLRHEAVILQEARRNDLDPALVAAVINVESGWTPDVRSRAGAVGLMQLLPDTARFIAQQPDRPSKPADRLTEPDVSIAYGTWYLRYLIDRHGSVPLALAAYNGGEDNVRRWEARARAEGRELRVPEDVPFPETRSFVAKVLRDAAVYRRAYGDQLGAPVADLARLPAGAGALAR
jgi:soluble lytic murein transglycosylase